MHGKKADEVADEVTTTDASADASVPVQINTPPVIAAANTGGVVEMSYEVFSADTVITPTDMEVDGEVVSVHRPILSVQLLPLTPGAHGTISLNLTRAQADAHPFKVGERIRVTFEEVKS